MSSVYYPDYLRLDQVLGAQAPLSGQAGPAAHDEMLFIIVHQAHELWFKQVLHEVESVIGLFADGHVDDNGGELNVAVHRLGRVHGILEVLVKQIDVLETMTPLDFLDFRDLLRPASGFQSLQFKVLEARLGLRAGERHAGPHYTSPLRPEDRAVLQAAEAAPSLLDLVQGWLERMPFLGGDFWPAGEGPFPDRLKAIYAGSLVEGEQGNTALWDQVFDTGLPGHRLSPAASRSALFIMLYRDEPLFQPAFRFLERLMDLDEGLAMWRHRHLNMVRRMIGLRVGTGGSTGQGYLKGAMDRHQVFQEIAGLSTFLFERRKLPPLPEALRGALRFGG